MKKALLKTIAWGIILFFGVTVVNAQGPRDIAKEDIAKMARASSVSLTMDNGSYGSGFFVLPNQIVTCYHVIEGASSGYVSPVLENNEKYSIVGISAIDKDNDLVILKVSRGHGTPLIIGDSKMVDILNTIYVVGNPNEIAGTVTTAEITNLIDDTYILMSAPISPGSSGGAVLNGRGKVIGISKGTILDRENRNQNLNVAVPSNYLRALLKANPNQSERGLVKPLSMEGVTGSLLTWESDSYEFTLHNQRDQTIRDVDCLIIFKDRKGEILCADRHQIDGIMMPGGAQRYSRYLVSKWIDSSEYDPGRGEGWFTIFDDFNDYNSSNVGYRIKQLMKSHEIRILDFDIDTVYTRRGIPIPENEVTASWTGWVEELSDDSRLIRFAFSLQNHLNQYQERVFCQVVFYDKDGKPIDESLAMGQGISAMENQPRHASVSRSTKRLTKRVDFRIYRIDY